MMRHYFCLGYCLLLFANLYAQDRPTLGLALSGGGAKGIAHIGVISELEKAGIYADVVSGTSMGSIVGGLYALGYSPKQLEAVAANIKWSDYFSDSYASIYIPIEQRRLGAGYQLAFPIDSNGIVFPRGVLQGKKIQSLLTLLFTPAQHANTFDDFPLPFRAVATDMETGEAYVFQDGDAHKAIRASMAIPSIFAPVTVKDQLGQEKLLVDGLVVRNLPTQEAFDLGADFVLAVDVGAPLAEKENLTNLINILQQTADFGSIKLNDQQRAMADAIIDPDLSPFSSISYEATDSILQMGAKSARKAMPQIIEKLEAAGFNIPMKAPDRPAVLTDSLFLTAVRFETESPSTTAILKKLFKLKVPGLATNAQLEDQINKLYGSGFFDLIDFRFQPNVNGSELIINASTAPKWQMRLNAAYDSDYEVGLQVILAGRNVIGNGSLIEFNARISEFPRASIEYLLYTQTRPSIGVHLNADANFYPGRVYSDNELTAEFRAHHFRSKLGAFSGLGENRYLEIGLLSEYLSSNERFISLTPTNNILDRQAIFAEFIRDTYDRAIFPRKGSRSSIYLQRGISGRERLPDQGFEPLGNNTTLNARHRGILPFGSRVVAVTELAAGFVQYQRQNILNKLYLGRPLPNEPFFFNAYGKRHMELALSGFATAAFGLRFEIGQDNFVGLHYQYGLTAITDSPLITFDRGKFLNPDRVNGSFQGFGLILGTNTFLGPVQLNAEYDPVDGSTNFNLHFGYYF